MKVLQLNIVYNVGSTGRIVYEIHNQLLNQNHTSVVIYGQGKSKVDNKILKVTGKYEAKVYKLYSILSGYQSSGSFFSTNKILNFITKYKPDIVHLHVINGNFINHYRLLNYLKDKNIVTAMTLHSEDMYTGKCGHAYDCNKWKTGCGGCPQKNKTPKSWFFDRTLSEWKRKGKSYSGFENLFIVSVSKWLNDRASQSPWLKDKNFSVIGNGIDTFNVFRPMEHEDLKKKYLIKKNEKILLHVTASFNDPFKGGSFILELANRLMTENIRVIVIGPNNYSHKFPENIIFLNYLRNQKELAKHYSLADLTILTSKRETFSMVCAESLSVGTPVVGFKAGAPEQISLTGYSEFVDYGNVDDLENCVRNWINKKPLLTKSLVKKAKEHYSKERMVQKYLELYHKIKKE